MGDRGQEFLFLAFLSFAAGSASAVGLGSFYFFWLDYCVICANKISNINIAS
jgi:hypothetical protein